MNTVHLPTGKILDLFHDQKVVTMPQLKAALGTTVAVTVFRKLSALPYRSSYSHCGAYYTLDSIAQYDELGLWTYRDIHFSRYGTLLDTAAALVPQAAAGYWVDELEVLVQVAAKDTLRQLAQAGRLYRSPWEGALSLLRPGPSATAGAVGRQKGSATLRRRPAGRQGPLLQSAG